MDKETAVEFEKLKAAQRATDKELADVKKEQTEWIGFVRKIVIKVVTGLLLMGGSGILFGWHLSPEVRKALADLASK